MHEFDARNRRRKRRIFFTGLALVSLGTAGAALPSVADWWEGWSSTEQRLEDGRKHLTVTDPEGNIDFDEVLEPTESVFLTDELEYMILEPVDDEAELDRIIAETLGEARD